MSALNERIEGKPKRLGKYRLLVQLGCGGMATVHLAVHRGPVGFAKLVVIKQLHAHHADDPDMMGMFLDEARLAARLQHQNVVQTYEIDEEAGHHFMVMEFLDGQSLSRIISRPNGLSLAMRLRIIADLLGGLHHAHELADYDGTPLKVIHRDVNPQNIFVTYDGVVKVVDFGIAKAQSSLVHTAHGIVKGKIAYMAPEQIRGEDIDRRADLFAVGVMLWEAATGVRPWKGVPDITVLKSVVDGKFPSAREVFPELPEDLEAIILKALSPNPDDRYSSASELQAEIEAYLEKHGEHVTQRDIANTLCTLFEQERAGLKAVIEEQLREVEASPSSRNPATQQHHHHIEHPPTPTLQSEGTHARTHLTVPSSPWARRGVPSSAPQPTTFAVPVPSEPPMPVRPARSGLWRAATVVLGAAFAIGLGWGWSHPGSPAPAAAATTVQVTTAIGIPQSANVEVRLMASPPEARLFIDDRPLPSNPWKGNIPRDEAEHHFRAEAKGFTSSSSVVTFDKDRMIDVALAPLPEADTNETASASPSASPRVSAAVKSNKRRRLDDKNPYAGPSSQDQ